MLLLLQAVAQQLPPINVTVQSPPGAPVWVTVLLSAVVGAIFALMMEFIKPRVAKRFNKRSVADQVSGELMGNLTELERARDYMERGAALKDSSDLDLAILFIGHVTHDRFDHYFQTQKDLISELDIDKSLSSFYRLIKSFKTGKIILKQVKYLDRDLILAIELAKYYIRKHRIEYQRATVSPLEEVFDIAFRQPPHP